MTRGALKNLVTDKPAPITVKLAQIAARKGYPHDALQPKFPNATIDGDNVQGMHGNETVHGWARVGGSEVVFKRNNKDEKLVFLEYN